jgi:hypothetical protein
MSADSGCKLHMGCGVSHCVKCMCGNSWKRSWNVMSFPAKHFHRLMLKCLSEALIHGGMTLQMKLYEMFHFVDEHMYGFQYKHVLKDMMMPL